MENAGALVLTTSVPGGVTTSLLHHLKMLHRMCFFLSNEILLPWFAFTCEANGDALLVLNSRWRSFHGLFHPIAWIPVPPLSQAAPDERSSCTNFIPLHRGRTHVGDLTEAGQTE